MLTVDFFLVVDSLGSKGRRVAVKCFIAHRSPQPQPHQLGFPASHVSQLTLQPDHFCPDIGFLVSGGLTPSPHLMLKRVTGAQETSYFFPYPCFQHGTVDAWAVALGNPQPASSPRTLVDVPVSAFSAVAG